MDNLILITSYVTECKIYLRYGLFLIRFACELIVGYLLVFQNISKSFEKVYQIYPRKIKK